MSSPDNSDPNQEAIDEARERIVQAEKDALTITHELRQRMSPDYIKRQVKYSLDQKVEKINNEISQNYDNWRVIMLKTLTRNPLPTALVGLGMYWLLKNSTDVKDEWERQYRRASETWKDDSLSGPSVTDQIQGTLQSAKGKVEDGLAELQGRATDFKDQASQQTQAWKEESEKKIREMKGYVRGQAQYAKGEVNQVFENNPLALGGILVAIGAIVAATLPNSRKENELLGDSREKVMEAVKSKVQDTVEDVKHEAKKIAETVSKKVESTVS